MGRVQAVFWDWASLGLGHWPGIPAPSGTHPCQGPTCLSTPPATLTHYHLLTCYSCWVLAAVSADHHLGVVLFACLPRPVEGHLCLPLPLHTPPPVSLSIPFLYPHLMFSSAVFPLPSPFLASLLSLSLSAHRELWDWRDRSWERGVWESLVGQGFLSGSWSGSLFF